MIAKVAKNVNRAKPKAAPTTIPATVPFESRLLGRTVELGREFEIGLGKFELRELVADVECCISPELWEGEAEVVCWPTDGDEELVEVAG